jgi:hypothetical protein
LEVCAGYIRHESRNNFLTGPFTRKQIGSRGFRGAAKLTPEIKRPSGRNIHLTCAGFKFWNQLRLRRTDIGNRPTATQRWKLIGACDPELRLSFENPRRRYTQVVILV